MATTSKRKSVEATKIVRKPAAKKVAKKPVTAKAVAKPRAAKPAVSRAKAPAAPKAPVSWPVPPAPVAVSPVAPPPVPAAKPVLSGEARFNLIQKHAYLIGEKDGFRQAPDVYWFSAESLVDREHGPR